MDHAGVVVNDLEAATEFFAELGLVLQGETPVAGRWSDRIVGLEGRPGGRRDDADSGRQRRFEL